MEVFLRDVRYALRGMRRAPGFTAAAVLTLALGMGATTAIFSVIRGVLLAPLPYGDPGRRVMIWSRWVGFEKTWVADGEVLDYRRECPSFDSVTAWDPTEANLTGGGSPVRIGVGLVTANAFDTLGAKPILGRGFTEAEDRPGGPPVAVLGYGLWQSRFGGNPGAVGQLVEIDGVARSIVGIMPRGFALPTDFTTNSTEPSQAWMPLRMDPSQADHGSHGLFAAAHLAAGVSPERASAALKALASEWTRRGLYPENMRFEPFAVSLDKEIRGPARSALFLVFGAVTFLLLMACANVANLLLARAEGRQREISVRAAIGAGKGRLVRQLLTESFVLAVCGGVLGVALAWVGVRWISGRATWNLPVLAPIGIDFRMLLFAALLSAVTTFLFGLAPALRLLRLDLSQSLRDGAGGASAGWKRQRLRGTLAAAQMALAVMLLAGAGLMLRSLDALLRVDLGFDPTQVLTARLSLPEASYAKPEQVVALYRSLLERVRGLPGVRAAGVFRWLPLASPIGDWGLAVEGYVAPPGDHAKGDWQVASDGALEALGERVVRGRAIAPTDTAQSLPVVLINEAMAGMYWPGQDPIGKRMRMGSNDPKRPWMTIVGIVRNVRHNGVAAPIKGKFYVPYAQFPLSVGFANRGMTLAVRTSGPPLVLAGAIQARLKELDPNLPMANVRTMTDVVKASMSTQRWTGYLLSLFAGLALLLAAVGIAGVLAYLVNRSRREIGIRMALGASRGRVLSLVIGRGMTFAGAGIGCGLLGALLLTRVMAGLLYGVGARDPLTLAGVAVLLTAIAAAACAVPGFRASRFEPLEALRAE
jgi:putative ABC transport system permease protein